LIEFLTHKKNGKNNANIIDNHNYDYNNIKNCNINVNHAKHCKNKNKSVDMKLVDKKKFFIILIKI